LDAAVAKKQRNTSLFFAVIRCSSLFLMLIEIAKYFTVFRTTAGYGRAGPPVLAGNLQALTIP
jgi:hypothetical protein